MKINFQARQLFKSTYYQFQVPSSLQIVFHKQCSVVCILLNGKAVIN